MAALHLLLFAGLAPFAAVHACGQEALQNVAKCVTNFDVTQFSNLKFDAIAALAPTRQEFQQYCDVLNGLVSCVQRNLAGCSSEVDAAYQAYGTQLKTICNDVFFCNADAGECLKANPYVIPPEGTAQQPTWQVCNTLLPFTKCLKEKLRPVCQVVVKTENLERRDMECHRFQCRGIKTCETMFNIAQQSESGLDNAKCRSFKTYVSCVNDATPSCDGMAPPRGQPAASNIANMIGQACDLLGTMSSLYTCVAFTKCIDSRFQQYDPLSPAQFCETIQGVLGCAVDNAASCGVTPSAYFVKQLNQLMLDFADQGCGSPQFRLESCPALLTCKATLGAAFAGKYTFGSVCTAMASVQQCAAGALVQCSITQPSRGPTLNKTSEITGRLCEAFKGENIGTCDSFLNCLGETIRPEDRGIPSSRVWCRMAVKTLQCARTYGPLCQLPDYVDSQMSALYREYISAGCPDTYEQASGATDKGSSVVVPFLLSLAVHHLMFTRAA